MRRRLPETPAAAASWGASRGLRYNRGFCRRSLPMTPEQLFAAAQHFLDIMEKRGSDALNDEQHALLAYCYLDSQVQEGGFVQLIAGGYGGYVFDNPLADSLRRWQLKESAKVLDRAGALYRRHGAAIEAAASEGADTDGLRRRFADFEECDADYYEAAEHDLPAACAHVAATRSASAWMTHCYPTDKSAFQAAEARFSARRRGFTFKCLYPPNSLML